MKIFTEIKNEKTGFNFAGFLQFNIDVCYTPQNLWILRDFGDEKEGNILARSFTYKKVLSVMEAHANIDNEDLYGQIISVANGDFEGISNLILNLGEGTLYDYNQSDNDYLGYGGVYLIDIDELRTSPEFKELSVEECFAHLLLHNTMDYNLRTYRHILPSKQILNTNEYLDLQEQSNVQ